MSTYEPLGKAGRNKTIKEFPSPYSYTIIMYKLNGCMPDIWLDTHVTSPCRISSLYSTFQSSILVLLNFSYVFE